MAVKKIPCLGEMMPEKYGQKKQIVKFPFLRYSFFLQAATSLHYETENVLCFETFVILKGIKLFDMTAGETA
jgi:hypothetical protein